jgi:hypothetical protein
VACSTLGALGSLSSTEAAWAAPNGQAVTIASLGGTVRDSAGTPQIGVSVELLRADSTVIARVFTDHKGVYSFAAVFPGQYALKAVGVSYIPALKQNLRVRANTIVNLTLNTLYDLMQWTPQPQRVRANSEEDWAWTLRSASRRPLLRYLDDGEPVLIWDGAQETSPAEQKNARSKRRVRVEASYGGPRFGESGDRVSIAMQQDTSARRRMAMSADISPNSAGLADAMLGFRQEMTQSAMGSSSVQTLAAFMVDPQAGAGSQQGLQVGTLRTWESLQLLDDLEAEAGSEQVLARVGEGGIAGSQIFAALPFGRVTVHHGQSALEYRVASARAVDPEAGEAMPGAWLPVLSERDGQLVMEHGLHQELGWSTSAGPADLQLIIFGDNVENPAVEASGRLSANEQAGQWMLVDRASGLVRAAGPNYSTTGMLASVESRLPGHNHVKLSYASGDALVLQATSKPETVAAILQGAKSRRAQMYSVALSGTLDQTGTRWRASYRWQPASTVTQVAPFALDASEPYLNVYIRQPIHLMSTGKEGSGGLEAQIDLRNLLAEGYRPFLTSDGSTLYFAQAQQSIRGGLAFKF